MKATASILNPDAIEVAITTTMTVGEWKVIRAALKSEPYWPSGKLASLIADAVVKIEQQVYVTDREVS